MRHKSLIIIIIIAALIGGSFMLGMTAYLLTKSGESGDLFGGGEVGLVTVEGGIFESRDIVEEIDKYRKDDDIKALVVRIESPGGTVAASQEIYDAIKRAAAEKPVVASMGSVAASGGYYIACAATKIVANPASITGSIGVRMDHVQVGELLRWAKIGHETLKSGEYKDIASPDRPLSPAERIILERMLVEIHQQFKDIVKAARNLDDETLKKAADGRIFTGDEALKLGLVDQLGSLFDTVKLAGELSHIKGEPKVTEKHKPRSRWIERLFESVVNKFKSAALEGRGSFREPILLYWAF